MIITEKLIIKNVAYYKSKGYISDSNGFIEVSIDNLSKCSHQEILAKCDFCEVEKKVTYKYYNNNLKNGNMFSCSNKCGRNKSKITNLEKFGVEFPSQNKDIKEKVKKTNLKNFGHEYGFQNSEIKNKIKQSNLEKHGVEYISQNKEIKEKIKQTMISKYGVEHYTNLEKSKQNNLEKYGVDNPSKIKEFRKKAEQTNLEKYGITNYSKSEESRIEFIIANHLNYIKYLDNRISLFKCDLNKNHEFEIHKDNFFNRLKSNVPLCTICYPIGNSRSIKEELIYEYIKSIYSGEIIQSYRDGLEIDIFLPELKLGIEFNGLYWHSNTFKESSYHINKLNWFKSKGIDVKFIYEDDFDNNFEIIKSQISNWLGLTKSKIYARKCQIKEVNTNEYRDFLNSNHIQGFVASKLVYGLYHNEILVSLMCFDKKEGRLNMEETGWNLNRFCNLLNHQVVGGASKLLNHFIKTIKPSRIISYADKDWSNGNLYFKLGFKLVNESKPDYKYIVDGIRVHKQNFTKSKLSKMGHDISLTESQIMNNLGINKIYDCSKMKFEKKLGL